MGNGLGQSGPRPQLCAEQGSHGPYPLRGVVVLQPRLFHNLPHSSSQAVAFSPPASDPEATPFRGSATCAVWLGANLELVDRLARTTARRAGLAASEVDDFLSDVHLKLVENGYAVLRSFGGRSRLTTFLLTVIQRVAFDFRNARWGKWRSSAEAERQGRTALRLEELVYRDGLTFNEAVGQLRSEGEAAPRERLYAILVQLPARPRPDRSGAHEPQESRLIDPKTPEADAATSEAMGHAARLQSALKRVCDALAPEDRLALRLKFHSGLTLAVIARLLKIDEKRIYRQFDHALAEVRRALEADGFTAEAALAVMHGCDLDDILPAPSHEAPESQVW